MGIRDSRGWFGAWIAGPGMVILSDTKLIINGLRPKKDDMLRLPINEPGASVCRALRVSVRGFRDGGFVSVISDWPSLNA